MKCQHSLDDRDSQKLCVAEVPIFKDLSNKEMQDVVNASQSKTFKKGEFIFQAGDSLEKLLIIHKGRVKIYRLSESGKEQLLRILEPGDFIGELSLFSNDTSENYAEAMTETEICAIHRFDMQQMLVSHPLISVKILEEFSNRLRSAETTIERLSLQDAEKRIASYLVELVRTTSGPGPHKAPLDIVLPMSKKELASLLGSSHETLSRRLSTLQENGVITLSGQRKITILDPSALAELAK